MTRDPLLILNLETPRSRQIWATHERNFLWTHRSLDAQERTELKAEMIAHIAEAMRQAQGSEAERLECAISQYGRPDAAPPVWLAPMARALHLLAIPLISVAILLALLLVALGLADLIAPAQAGLWIYDDGDFALSFQAQAQARDVLGRGFAPIAFACASLLGIGAWRVWKFAVSPTGALSRWGEPVSQRSKD